MINMLISFLLFCWIGTGLLFANTAPVVSQVTANQRTDASKVVDIRYNLIDIDNDACTVSLQVSSDGGTTWAVQAVTFLPNSAIGSGIKSGNGKLIVWDAGKDLPGIFGDNYRIKIVADDGYNPIPVDMVIIPAGTFQMGNSKDASEGWSGELPVHTVSLDSFALGKYEITNDQYCAFLMSAYPSLLKVVNGIVYASSDTGNNNPYCDTSPSFSSSQIIFSNNTFSIQTKEGREMSKDPIVDIRWYGAVAYCNWRSQQEGKQTCYNLSTWNCDFSKKGYRLPTEAEWEYAARGGRTGNRFPWGDTINHNQANYYSYWAGGKPKYPYDVNPTEGYHPTWNGTSPVGSFLADNYGLCDMTGNVWEWCNDWYSIFYYDSSPIVNPKGPETGTYRILRGGSWFGNGGANYCRISFRNYNPPETQSYEYGFRIALDLN